jgi:predicted enzyme related to lactoylglutathione lyase
VRVFRIAVPASDIAESVAFYQRVLGIEPDDTVPSRVYFHCADVIVAVIDWSVEGRGEFHPTPENLYFATDEIDAVYDRTVAVGATIVSAIEIRSWGERSFYCVDPDGNRLCFVDEATLFLGRGADWS